MSSPLLTMPSISVLFLQELLCSPPSTSSRETPLLRKFFLRSLSSRQTLYVLWRRRRLFIHPLRQDPVTPPRFLLAFSLNHLGARDPSNLANSEGMNDLSRSSFPPRKTNPPIDPLVCKRRSVFFVLMPSPFEGLAAVRFQKPSALSFLLRLG